MTPDEVKDFVEINYPDIKVEPRHNPDGWAFF